MEESKCISMFYSHSEGPKFQETRKRKKKMQFSDLKDSEGKESALGMSEEQSDPLCGH